MTPLPPRFPHLSSCRRLSSSSEGPGVGVTPSRAFLSASLLKRQSLMASFFLSNRVRYWWCHLHPFPELVEKSGRINMGKKLDSCRLVKARQVLGDKREERSVGCKRSFLGRQWWRLPRPGHLLAPYPLHGPFPIACKIVSVNKTSWHTRIPKHVAVGTVGHEVIFH